MPYFPSGIAAFFSNLEIIASIAASNTYIPSAFCTTGAEASPVSSVSKTSVSSASGITTSPPDTVSSPCSSPCSSMTASTGSVSCTCSTTVSSACTEMGLIPIPDSTIAPASSSAISRFLSFLPLLPNIFHTSVHSGYKRIQCKRLQRYVLYTSTVWSQYQIHFVQIDYFWKYFIDCLSNF